MSGVAAYPWRAAWPAALTLDSTAPPRLLSIAGSDSGGGAGIQADLKAFARCGTHGMTAITAITAQNTREVTAVHPVSPAGVLDQVRAVVDDIGVDAVKIGMLGDVATIEAVERRSDLSAMSPSSLDPVMVPRAGRRFSTRRRAMCSASGSCHWPRS